MAKSPTEQVRELAIELTALSERLVLARFENSELRAALAASEAKVVGLVADVARQDKELALLRQQFDKHVKDVELWDGRRWGLLVVLVGAVLSLASGLIVTLARK
jgi:type II secretory pathway component PulL